jgi:hypothetical protein
LQIEAAQGQNGSVYQFDGEGELSRWYLRQDFFGSFTEAFELKSYPFDVQDFTIKVEMNFWSSKDAIFVPPSAGFSPLCIRSLHVGSEFEIVGLIAEYIEEEGFSACLFRAQGSRHIEAVMWRVVFFMFLLGLTSLGTFALPITSVEDRLAHCTTLVLAAVAFQFVVSQELPNVPYLTFVDKYITFCFIFILGMLLHILYSSMWYT